MNRVISIVVLPNTFAHGAAFAVWLLTHDHHLAATAFLVSGVLTLAIAFTEKPHV